MRTSAYLESSRDGNKAALFVTGTASLTSGINEHIAAVSPLEQHVQSTDGFLVTNLDGIISDVNPIAAKLFNARFEFLLGKPLLMFVAHADRRLFLQHLAQFQRIGGSRQFQVLLQVQPNKVITVLLHGQITGYGESAVIHWFVRDDSRYQCLSNAFSKKRAQVYKSKKQIRVLRHRLVTAQETERRSLAHELHDEFGQSLTGLKITLERLVNKPAQTELSQAISTVDGLIEQLRALSLDLYPTMLDDLGLLPTLLWNFQRFYEQTQIVVKFMHNGLLMQDGLMRRFGRTVETAAYRIIQEALTNVARYAQVGEVHINVHVCRDHLEVMITDQGVGFEPGQVQAAQRSHGLVSMAERARSVRGRLTVSAAPGLGTCIRAELPLSFTPESDVGG